MLSKKQSQLPIFVINNSSFKSSFFFIIFLTAWFFFLFYWLPPTNPKRISHRRTHHLIGNHVINNHVRRQPFSVYIYDLPPEFNLGLVKNCHHLNVYTDMCPHVANHGLGQPLEHINAVSPGCWFATHQFIAEMIFHARLENHPLRTWDPSRATLFYVPFYGGLYASGNFRETNLTARDDLAVRFSEFLKSQPWWQRANGKDHFVVLGRTAWDFMRTTSGPDFGANTLLNLPRVQNVSVLTVERNPWRGSNQHGIPYPSYFHPSTSSQMLAWQQKMRLSKRPNLFTFIGAPRKGLEKAAIRDELIKQCGQSTRCKLLTCSNGSGASNKCYSPSEILGVMSKSQFCLQAPGDSFTRRSTFDSVLAGCIPVFFSQHTAYTQYAWYLPQDAEEYSVYINGEEGNNARRKRIEDELMKIPRKRVEKMRNKVIDLIPRVTYKHPNASDDGEFEDAVDVALAALANHVRSLLGRELVL
ncbi:hypothetical protein WN944_025106 [Citrus x changshan-huyou]|uniref:Exostosin GT47 domain-containing protein n=1 Tax=Citrus x changshan-huyou TaxID=2935761 RepID=A0AAP0LVG9_9ROSI